MTKSIRGLAFLMVFVGCQHPDHRAWDWVVLGDANEACIQPEEWLVFQCRVAGDTVTRTSIQQIAQSGFVQLPVTGDTMDVRAFRVGDALVHRKHGQRVDIMSKGEDVAAVSSHLIQRSGWQAFANAVGVSIDTLVHGCYVDWLEYSSSETFAWGTEVAVEVAMASLPNRRAAGEWERQDAWTFPFGASDQLIPPLDTLMSLQRAGFEAWCLASLGHEPVMAGQDTATAFRVTWRAATRH